MQQTKTVSESHRGPALRRGKQITPIDTNLDHKPTLTRAIQRPRPIETIIYEKSPAQDPNLHRRISKGGLRGLFSRNRSANNVKGEDRVEYAIREEDVTDTLLAKIATPLIRSTSNGPVSSAHSGTAVPKANVVLKTRTKAPTRETKTKSSPGKKEENVRSLKAWNPPPLFQAYPQSLKHSNLPAPTTSVDILLKMDKSRRTVESTVDLPGDEPSDENDQQTNSAVKKSKSRKSSSFQIDWTSKVYVLVTSGCLLQYAGDGKFDRMPEKVLQLGKDSAAFASDAIPGKRWVLQILQSATDDGATTTSKSVFSRFGFRSELKRSVPSFLLVMDSPEEMDTWLVAVRKEIEALGGKQYRPNVGIRKNTDEVIQTLRERPSRRYLIKQDPKQFSVTRASFVPSVDTGYHEKDMSDTTSMHELESSNAAKRMARGSRLSIEAPSTTHTSISTDQVLLDRLRESVRTSYASTDGRTYETSYDGSPVPSPVTANFLAKQGVGNSSAISSPASKDTPPRRSFQTLPLETNDQRMSLDHVPISTSSRPHSINRSSTVRSLSPGTPNFSAPSFSKRYSQCVNSARVLTPPATADSTTRRTSTLKDEDLPRERPQSVIGELPTSIRASPKPARSSVGLPTEISSPNPTSVLSNTQGDKAVPQLLTSTISHSDRPVPRRFSSIEYFTSAVSAHSRHPSSPHPPPTTALPALPPSSTLTNSHNPSRGSRTSTHTLRRPASMQVCSDPNPQLRAASSQARVSLSTKATARSYSGKNFAKGSVAAAPPSARRVVSQGNMFPSVPLVTVEASTPEMLQRSWTNIGPISTSGVRVS